MAKNTKIQWATHTFNPWRGCTKIAAGCANCYADAQSKRNPKTLGIWGPNGTRVVASEAMWLKPVKWNREASCHCGPRFGDRKCEWCRSGCHRPRVFCASLADVFEDWRGPVVNSRGDRLTNWLGEGRARTPMSLDDVRARLFRLIDATPNLDWLLLTKRPVNVRTKRMWNPVSGQANPLYRKNVWLGTSIACQEDADRNVPALLKCSDLCSKTFLSLEPLIGPVDLYEALSGAGSMVRCAHDGIEGVRVDWVIVGGESGPNARPCNIEWIRSIVRQCQEAGVSCFVKQWGSNPHYTNHQGDSHSCGPIRDPKGGDPAEWPEDVRVREVPVAKGGAE